jgi:hypothetical protein
MPEQCLPHVVHLTGLLLGIFFSPEDGGNTFLENTDELLPDHMVSHFRN